MSMTERTTKTATFVRVIPSWKGDARLYKVDPPVEYDGGATTDHVIVSAVDLPIMGAETYIFPASAEGSEPLGWRELDGSYRGALDHAVALRGAGYEVQS